MGNNSQEKSKNKEGNVFDNVFRTLVNDCKRQILPVLNEMFHYSYTGNEKVVLLPTERQLHSLDGKNQRRGTDSAFCVTDKDGLKQNFIIECQSKPDNSMIVRILEYGVKFAIDNAEKSVDKIRLQVPNTAILQLRSNSNTHDSMQVELVAPDNNSLFYDVPVMNMKKYSLEDIFDKKLTFIIPFYMFNKENMLKNMPKRDCSKEILEDCNKIKNYIKKLPSTFERKSISQMFLKVMNSLSNNERAKALYEEVEKIMEAQVLQYEAKNIYNEGMEEGIEKGREEGREEGIGIGEFKIFRNVVLPRLEIFAQNYNNATNNNERQNAVNKFDKVIIYCREIFDDWDNEKIRNALNNLIHTSNIKFKDNDWQNQR